MGNCECKEGYYNDSELFETESCLACEYPCEKCLSASVCLTCIDKLDYLNSEGKCIKFCNGEQNEECINCTDLCDNCTSELKCISCVNNSYLYNDLECRCRDGYVKTGKSCIEKYFYGEMSINSQNKIKLTFSEEPKYMLDKKFITLKVDEAESEYFIKTINISSYFFSTNINGLAIKHRIELKIVKSKILSKNNSMLKDYIYTVFTNTISKTEDQALTIVKSKTTVQTVTSTAACISLVSNPSALWSLLNTIQLITFMPLNSVPYSEKLKGVAVSFIHYNIVPNIFEDIFLPNSTSEPYEQAQKFGLTTSVILLNAGRLFTILIFFIFANLLLFFLAKIFKENSKVQAFEKKFRYKLFMAFWIQAYLELVIYSFIQLKTDVNYNIQGNINLIIAFFVAFFGILTPLFFLYTMSFALEQPNESKFSLLYETLFEDLKVNRGFLSISYYPLFLLRRLLYSASQIFLVDFPIAQAYSNVFFSLLFCFYVIYYRPYKEKMINFVQISGEICILTVFIISSLFLFSISEDFDNYIGDLCIYLIFAHISINLFVSFYYFAKGLGQLYKKLEKIRAEQFIEFANKNLNSA